MPFLREVKINWLLSDTGPKKDGVTKAVPET